VTKENNPAVVKKFNAFKNYILAAHEKIGKNPNDQVLLTTYRSYTDSIGKISSAFALKKSGAMVKK
jgi:hypothetical protein